jgi:hypothetical protein
MMTLPTDESGGLLSVALWAGKTKPLTDAQLFSWILVSVSAPGSTLRQISETADAINHAIPTEHELQTSLRWLQERGLIRELNGRVMLTDAGAALVGPISSPTGPIMPTWRAVEDELKKILER